MSFKKDFRNLTIDDKNIIRKAYADQKTPRDTVQENLAKFFGVEKRCIRGWAKRLEIGVMKENIVRSEKILIYDIETSRTDFKAFWTGKQFLGHSQAMTEPRIISVAWKWLGDEKVEYLVWDKNHSDRELVEKFLDVYNEADMVFGYNSDNFDNRWINARAFKYDLFVNIFVKSFDLMKELKKFGRFLSYSMSYIAKFRMLTLKLSHEGMHMWDMIENGTPEQQEEYLAKMVEYNCGDIITTEQMFIKTRKYMGHKIHFGVFNGEEKFTCPHCSGSNVELFKSTWTAAGTAQHIMKCSDDDVQYKISNRDYVKFLDEKYKQFV